MSNSEMVEKKWYNGDFWWALAIMVCVLGYVSCYKIKVDAETDIRIAKITFLTSTDNDKEPCQ